MLNPRNFDVHRPAGGARARRVAQRCAGLAVLAVLSVSSAGLASHLSRSSSIGSGHRESKRALLARDRTQPSYLTWAADRAAGPDRGRRSLTVVGWVDPVVAEVDLGERAVVGRFTTRAFIAHQGDRKRSFVLQAEPGEQVTLGDADGNVLGEVTLTGRRGEAVPAPDPSGG